MARKIPHVSDDTRMDTASEVADLLQAVTHRLRREARHELGSNEITWAQMRALRVLARIATPTRMSDLADELNIARRSTTSVVDQLEAKGLVVRVDDAADRRAVMVEVTSAGQRLVDDLSQRRRQAAVGLLGELSGAELRALRDLLARVVSRSNQDRSGRTPPHAGSALPENPRRPT
jgi:DNA-binding MarR family transcriptional regulator